MRERIQRIIHRMGNGFNETSREQNVAPESEVNTIVVQGRDTSWMASRVLSIEEFMSIAFAIPENQEICLACVYYDGPPPENLDHTDMMRRFSDINKARSWFQNEYIQNGFSDLKIFLRRPMSEKEREQLMRLASSHPLYKSEVMTRHNI